jgi:hypothetical protein
MENKFLGNADRGKEIFRQIEIGIERQKSQQDYRQWEQEEETMEGIESSSSTGDYHQSQAPKKDDNSRGGGGGGYGSPYMWGSISIIALIGLMFTR